MDILDHVATLAKKACARIVLPEGEDPRIQEAAARVQEQGIARTIILTNNAFAGLSLDDQDKLISIVQEARKKEELSTKKARELLQDNRWVAAAMVRAGMADGFVSGSMSPTKETLAPALKIVGTSGLASSYFLMLKDDRELLFTDCAFNVCPEPEELAHIALDTAKSAEQYGIDPRIAFLSFSTKGSARHDEVDAVSEAVAYAKRLDPNALLDGELQFDAAFVPEVALSKAPQSPLKGRATIYVFPDLNSGNIGYKIAQRLGGWQAIGPILQGLKHPVNDLSRGCSVEDIVYVVAITSMQTLKQ